MISHWFGWKYESEWFLENVFGKDILKGGRHSSVVSSAPTIPGPGFESQAHHLCFFQFVLLKLYPENNKNKQKEAGIGPFKKKTFWKCSILLANAFKLIHNDYVSLI